jgi:hypothetical protein
MIPSSSVVNDRLGGYLLTWSHCTIDPSSRNRRMFPYPFSPRTTAKTPSAAAPHVQSVLSTRVRSAPATYVPNAHPSIIIASQGSSG